MFSKDILIFLEELKVNNNKEWFQDNRKRYDAIRKECLQFVEAWIQEFGKYDASVLTVEPKQCMFRINRDIRFSNDKSPYKTNLGLYLVVGGKKSDNGGYYLHIEPNHSFFGGGKYDPSPQGLANIRQEIDYNFDEFKSILSDTHFKKSFSALNEDNKLKRAPKGYEDDNLAIEYLKLKSFTAFAPIQDEIITSNKLIKQVVDYSNHLKPLVDFLNRSSD